jgi:DNA-binding NtrC family response regulator
MMGTTLRVALSERHEVQVVDSGHDARRILEDNPRFDAIVCDLMMPDISGMELYQWLHARVPALADRMIFMTGGAYTDSARDFLDRVGNPRVQKPFDVDELIDLVCSVGA